ncbi:MAG: hypothetical protein WC471_00940 [Candidatus Woesearchaeota archaeon]
MTKEHKSNDKPHEVHFDYFSHGFKFMAGAFAFFFVLSVVVGMYGFYVLNSADSAQTSLSEREQLPTIQTTPPPADESPFLPESIINTENGISLSIDKFEFENKGTWGKITKLEMTLLNKGVNTISPTITVRVYSPNADAKDRSEDLAVIDLEVLGLGVGQHVIKNIPQPISFSGNGPKILKITAYDGWLFDKQYLVSTEKTFEVK